MGKLPPNSHKQRLADMAVYPARDYYRPPGLDVAKEVVTPIDISPVDQLVMRQRFYREKIVDFALAQKTMVEKKWVDVARIDCCHSKIHRHQFDQTGVDLYDSREIIRIPSGEAGWEVVDRGYDSAYTLMTEEWEANLERWRSGH